MGKLKQFVSLALFGAGLVGAVLTVPAPANAALDPGGGGNGCTGDLASFLGLQNWDACLSKDTKNVPQFKDLTDIWRVVTVVIEDMLKVAGYLAVGYLIWGGFKYIKSQGEPGETTQARQIINNALMGLVIVLLSVAIVQFVAGTFS